jgi:hypothetical protein
MPHVLVWDIETVPDLAGFAAADGHDGKTEDEIRAELGDKFPKHIYHSIICIGALIAPVQPFEALRFAIANVDTLSIRSVLEKISHPIKYKKNYVNAVAFPQRPLQMSWRCAKRSEFLTRSRIRLG